MGIAKPVRVLAAVAAVGLLATACGGSLDGETSSSAAPTQSASGSQSSSGGEGATGTLKIGFVSPQTGPLAGFGRLYLAVGLGGQPVQTIGRPFSEPAAAGIDASGRASSAIPVA